MDDDPREDDARADQRLDEDASERWARWQRAKASAATLMEWDADAARLGSEEL